MIRRLKHVKQGLGQPSAVMNSERERSFQTIGELWAHGLILPRVPESSLFNTSSKCFRSGLEFYRQRERKEAVSAEIKASLDLHFGGQGKEKQLRLAVSELIFAVKSKEAADHLPPEHLERGLHIRALACFASLPSNRDIICGAMDQLSYLTLQLVRICNRYHRKAMARDTVISTLLDD